MLASRWRVVVALFAVTSCIAAAVSTFGVFLPVLSDTFGWSRGAVSVALSISLVVGGVAAFVIGRVADRRGPRGVLAATVTLGAVGFALSARIDALWHFYLSYGLLVGVGMSSIYVLSAATVARWFETRRGMALAIVLSGFNLGWLTAGPLAAWLIGRFGWRAAYVALGALIAVVGVPASLCVSYPPAAEARPVTAGGGARRVRGRPARLGRAGHARRLRPRWRGRRQHDREGGARRVRAGGAGHDHERGGLRLAQRRRARAGARGIRVRPDGLVHAVVRVRPRGDRRRLEVLPARQRDARALTGPRTRLLRHQHHLGLDRQRQELAALVGDARLPHLRAPPAVQRRRFRAHRARFAGGEEVGLRLEQI